jgi:hypothetical protein
MKKTALMMICGLMVVNLAACHKEPKTVSYYKDAAHEAERKELVKKFLDNPRMLKDNPDAVNAVKAEQDIESARVMKYTPVKVDTKGAGTLQLK